MQAFVNEGYDPPAVSEALALTADDLPSAREYVISGILVGNAPLTRVSSCKCPFFYLEWEVAERFIWLLNGAHQRCERRRAPHKKRH
jgi:hypothetical protein